MQIYLYIIFALVALSVLFTTVNILTVTVEAKKIKERRKRQNQLMFVEEKDVTVEEAIEKITEIMEIYVFKSKAKPKDILTEIRLRMIGWDKYFEAEQWKAFSVFMIFVGIAIGFTFSFINTAYGVLVGGFFALMPQIYYLMETKDVRFSLLSQFPNIIILINGYLRAGYTLDRAIESTVPFTGKRWSIMLTKLAADIEMMGVDYALNELKLTTDIPEVREFCSLVKIAYAQGSVGDSFESQAMRMRSVQEDIMLQKIAARRSLAIVAQAPTMLAVFLLVGAPAVKQVMEMTSMLG